MSTHNKKLPFSAKMDLIDGISSDYVRLSKKEEKDIPNKLSYKISHPEESPDINRSARKAAFATFNSSIQKVAFDTRRVNQEDDRNPRSNLQYWHRSQEFIDEGQQKQINVYAKLFKTLTNIKRVFGTRPDWHESYSRVLYDAVERVLRIKQADDDIHPSQLAYLDQLLFARYRLSSEDIMRMSADFIGDRILSKDESLLKRGVLYKEDNMEERFSKLLSETVGQVESKVSTQAKDQNVINVYSGGESKPEPSTDMNNVFATLFGAPNRKDGERNVERIITISIKDNVIE